MACLLLVLIAVGLCGVRSQSLDKSQNGKCLSAHNIFRALHRDTSPLQWDDVLAEGAQQWALNLARTGRFEHSRGNGRYGENIYKSWGSLRSRESDSSCVKASHSWYSEERDYNYNGGRFSSYGITGHFTQMVWKGSTKLGVGIAKKGSTIVIVARYTPAGNFRGRYQQNVIRRHSGARTPSLSELSDKVNKGGLPEPATARPPPEPVTQGPPEPVTQGPPEPVTHGPPPPIPETAAPDCKDEHQRGWRHCRRNRRWCRRSQKFKMLCKKTCGVCY